MSTDEMSKYIEFLLELVHQKDSQYNALQDQFSTINSELKSSNAVQKRLNEMLLSVTTQLHQALQTISELNLKISNYESSQRISKKERFGGLSQKGIEKKQDVTGRDDNKGDFDGISASLPTSTEVDVVEEAPSEKHSESRPSRQVCTHSKMSADYQVLHKCDMNQIPSDAIILKTSIHKVFDSVNVIVEHDFEEITYKTADDHIVTSYFFYVR